MHTIRRAFGVRLRWLGCAAVAGAIVVIAVAAVVVEAQSDPAVWFMALRRTSAGIERKAERERERKKPILFNLSPFATHVFVNIAQNVRWFSNG